MNIKAGDIVKLKPMDMLRSLFTMSKTHAKDLERNQGKLFKVIDAYNDDALKGSGPWSVPSVFVLQLDKDIFSDIDNDVVQLYKNYINADAMEVLRRPIELEEKLFEL